MRRAFTLIEVLIVVSVVAILAAILFPAFIRTRERARCTQCISNLRQIHAAVCVYAADWDDRYPWAWREDGFTHGWTPYLCEALAGYTRDNRIWQCPSDIGETFPDGPNGFRRHTPPFYRIGTSSYDYIGRGYATAWNLSTRTVGSVRMPSYAVLAMEMRPWHGGYRPDDDFIECPGLDNVLYCDGHVARKTAAQYHADERLAISRVQ